LASTSLATMRLIIRGMGLYRPHDRNQGEYQFSGRLLGLQTGIKGVYQHCAEKHLHRYVAGFDYRHNQHVALGVDDVTLAGRVLSRVSGKRLTYRTTN
jgi:hypothetical protein